MNATNDSRKIAIYSRKSRFTGKGESIENQIELCRQYINTHKPNINYEDIIVFEDEGFSGGNIDRPKFKEMMTAAKEGKLSDIVCYRLDRISRNIGDFAKLIEDFNTLNISFISIKEQFDTSSPLGRAMMYIASVFSQLERETIAERIRDNMHELAKTGRWLGGNTPTGYTSEQVEKITADGKARKAYKLDILKSEAILVKQIFDKFIETNSLTAVETDLLQKRITTKNGKNFTRFSIKNILQNPVYMIADKDAWKYFKDSEVDLFSEELDFDGKHGIMAYNKTIQKPGKTNEIRDMNEWIIAVGKHKGIISGADWVNVQKSLDQNKSKAYRKPKSNTALLSGLLYCGNCGNYMRSKVYNTEWEYGEKRFAYLCETKEKSRMHHCNMKNPNGNTLDRMVCEEIKKLSGNSSEFVKQLENAKKSIQGDRTEYDEKLNYLKKIYDDNQKEIDALVKTMSKSDGSPAYDYIFNQINELHNKNQTVSNRIQELESLTKEHILSDIEFDIIKDLLTSFGKTFNTMTVDEKRVALRTFIRKIVWDGENVHIYLFGTNDDDEIEYPPNDNETEPFGGDSK